MGTGDVAWACRTTPENKQVIASEHPKFDEALFEQWLNEHESGYFVRDQGHAFDCTYMSDTVFDQIYAFEPGYEGELFGRIIHI